MPIPPSSATERRCTGTTSPPSLPTTGNCNTSAVQCCNSLQRPDSNIGTLIFDLSAVPSIGGSNAEVGFACGPTISGTGLNVD
ncbi:hypothetical protein HGRIS_008921, partial [Hohenbuehelia grisea]